MIVGNPPVVDIEQFHYAENTYSDGNAHYRVRDLITAAALLPVFDVPLASLPIGGNPWGSPSVANFVYHVRRTENADMSYPIILDADGHVADGYHRIAKAILEGQATIKAVRLVVMPEPIREE